MRLSHPPLTLALVLVGSAVASDEAPPRTVSTAGTIVTKVVPDTVLWHVTVRIQNPNLTDAKSESDERLRMLLEATDELGVSDRNVQTGRLSIRKVYERDREGNQREFRWYEVTRQVAVRQTSLEHFDEFLTELVAVKEIDIQYSLESSEFHDVRAETRIKAVKMARDKAQAMAEALDAKVGQVLTINEDIPSGEPWASRAIASNAAVYRAPSEAEPDAGSGTFAPGAIEIKVTVHTTFELK